MLRLTGGPPVETVAFLLRGSIPLERHHNLLRTVIRARHDVGPIRGEANRGDETNVFEFVQTPED
jgi:hypothetical protein